MAKATTDATFEQKQKKAWSGRLLGNLVWSMSRKLYFRKKLSEELSEDELKILKMDVDENQKQRVLSALYVHSNLAL